MSRVGHTADLISDGIFVGFAVSHRIDDHTELLVRDSLRVDIGTAVGFCSDLAASQAAALTKQADDT